MKPKSDEGKTLTEILLRCVSVIVIGLLAMFFLSKAFAAPPSESNSFRYYGYVTPQNQLIMVTDQEWSSCKEGRLAIRKTPANPEKHEGYVRVFGCWQEKEAKVYIIWMTGEKAVYMSSLFKMMSDA